MAATVFSFNISSVPLAATVAKTVAQIKAPTNQRVRLLKFGVSFDGITNTNVPCRVRIVRQTSPGTGLVAGTANLHEGDLTLTPNTSVATGSLTTQTEPTQTLVMFEQVVHPQGGNYNEIAVQGQEIIIPPGMWLGFEVKAPAGVNVSGTVTCEE